MGSRSMGKGGDFQKLLEAESRYHDIKTVEYPLPNDEEEQKRLEDMQLVFRTILGGNILAPICGQPTNILDVGTGGGAWVVEVGKEYAETTVCGLDISPITRSDASENCKFLQADLTEGLPFDGDCMDLVHSRWVILGG